MRNIIGALLRGRLGGLSRGLGLGWRRGGGLGLGNDFADANVGRSLGLNSYLGHVVDSGLFGGSLRCSGFGACGARPFFFLGLRCEHGLNDILGLLAGRGEVDDVFLFTAFDRGFYLRRREVDAVRLMERPLGGCHIRACRCYSCAEKKICIAN